MSVSYWESSQFEYNNAFVQKPEGNKRSAEAVTALPWRSGDALKIAYEM
jgi:hypothetical protein